MIYTLIDNIANTKMSKEKTAKRYDKNNNKNDNKCAT